MIGWWLLANVDPTVVVAYVMAGGGLLAAIVAGVLAKKPQDRNVALEEMKAALAWQHDEILDLRQKVAECHTREAKTQIRLADLEAVVRRVGRERTGDP